MPGGAGLAFVMGKPPDGKNLRRGGEFNISETESPEGRTYALLGLLFAVGSKATFCL